MNGYLTSKRIKLILNIVGHNFIVLKYNSNVFNPFEPVQSVNSRLNLKKCTPKCKFYLKKVYTVV